VTKGRISAALILVLIIVALVVSDAGSWLSLENFKDRQAELNDLVRENFLFAAATYFLIYVVTTALSIPGAAVLTLIGGALFGVLYGTVIVSFASTIGASLAFLVARYLLRETVELRFPSALKRINQGIEKDGAFYLFGLRLVPLFPFFAINLVTGLTRFPVTKFFWVSQLGMLPGTIVYVNAGTQISRIESASGILSANIIGAFVLLAVFPLLAKKLLALWQQRRVYAPYKKPASFDTNMVVIGAGAAGLVTAYIAAGSKARVILVERENMGGDCLNTGCVPSKALIRSAKVMSTLNHASDFGVKHPGANVDFQAVMQRVQRVIREIEPHDSIERYTGLGVDCAQGNARITSPWTVEIDGSQVTCRSIVIATGGKPFVPPIPGLEDVDYLTSDTVWSLDKLPERLAIIGGGFIGCELAQAFQRLGSKVTVVEGNERILSTEDPDVSAAVTSALQEDSVEVLTGHRATNVETNVLHCEHINGERSIGFDELLVAVGRRANTGQLGLDNIGISVNDNGTVPVNEYLQTKYPNIYACGDVTGPYQLTHVAAHQAWYCAVNALFGTFRKFRADYSVIPRAIFTDPEFARVGLNEKEALEQGIPYAAHVYGVDDLDRAIADGTNRGFVKVLTPPDKDTILGVSIVSANASDMLAEYTLAMRHGLGLRKILGTIHPYPTMSEANKYAAGVWQKAHLPQKLLNIAARWHAWRRG